MTFQDATLETRDYREDQDGADYIRDQDGFAIQCLGHYTIAELQFKIRQLEDANKFYA
tara:strand:- start:806 stop:979 length:174 start_codon:yes stop_codon:yes gene_type:complete